MWFKALIFFFALFFNIGALDVGDKCKPTQNISDGECVLIDYCKIAISHIKAKLSHPFKRCGFIERMEIVCCPKNTYPEPSTLPSTTTVSDKRYGTNMRIADKQCKNIVSRSIPPLNLHIIGGIDASEGEFPHMAALGYRQGDIYDFKCGGSLISEMYILTAAHCLENIEQTKPSIARLGEVDISSKKFNPDSDIEVADTIVHPQYVGTQKYHDLALVRLARPAQFSASLNAACLYTKPDIPNVPLTVTGWGRISRDTNIRSDLLQKANVTLVPSSECSPGYEGWRKLPKGIADGQFCAGEPMGRTDTCQGDSGGPLQAFTTKDGFNRIIGLTSFGRGCGSTTPGVYTRVSAYLDWIESVVWPNGV